MAPHPARRLFADGKRTNAHGRTAGIKGNPPCTVITSGLTSARVPVLQIGTSREDCHFHNTFCRYPSKGDSSESSLPSHRCAPKRHRVLSCASNLELGRPTSAVPSACKCRQPRISGLVCSAPHPLRQLADCPRAGRGLGSQRSASAYCDELQYPLPMLTDTLFLQVDRRPAPRTASRSSLRLCIASEVRASARHALASCSVLYDQSVTGWQLRITSGPLLPAHVRTVTSVANTTTERNVAPRGPLPTTLARTVLELRAMSKHE